jgi:hypothetical protein
MIIIPKSDQFGENFLYPASTQNNLEKYVIKKDFSDLANTYILHLQNMAKIAGITGVITYYSVDELVEFIKANIQFE